MFHFHKWTKWQEYNRSVFCIENGKEFKATETWQFRECKVCGYKQREQVGAY
jgi:hypothetical protein